MRHENSAKNKKRNSHSRSYFQTVLLSFLSVSLIATFLLTAFLTLNYVKSSSNMVTSFQQNLLAQTNYAIDQMNVNVRQMTLTLFRDHNIISYLYGKNPYGQPAVLANQELHKHLVSMPNMESICLYNASEDAFFSSKTGIVTQRTDYPDKTAAFRINDPAFIASYNGVPIINADGSENGASSTISYYCFDSSLPLDENKSAVIFNVSSSYITNSIRSMSSFQDNPGTSFVVMDAEGVPVSSVLYDNLEELPDLYRTLFETASAAPGKYLRLGGTVYLTAVTRANDNGWYLLSLTPLPSLFRSVLISALLGTAIMAAVMIVCFAACLFFARRLNMPIQAINSMMKGDSSDLVREKLQGAEEFRQILASYENMHSQNLQLSRSRRENLHSSRQNYLNMLLTGNHMESHEQISRRLKELDLSWLSEGPLCMAVFKIDNYRSFCDQNNQDELWVLRFAAVNIMEETAAHSFTCSVLNRDNDKFVILIDCREALPYKALTEKLEAMIDEIRQNILHYMKISMTAAYSPTFGSLKQLSGIYAALEDALHMKIKFGHGAVISPHMLDDTESESYQFPDALADELTALILAGSTAQAAALSHKLALRLFAFEYSEILSGMIHLLYSLYLSIERRFPQMVEEATRLLKTALSALPDAEVTEDFELLLNDFVTGLCEKTAALLQSPAEDNAAALTGRVCEIVERDYPNPALCLSYIAEEIGLTSNYIGKVFKSVTQKSVSQYISDYRMDILAKYLDESSLPLNTILDKVGLEKTNYFYTQFKKHFGMSLMDYRKRPAK